MGQGVEHEVRCKGDGYGERQWQKFANKPTDRGMVKADHLFIFTICSYYTVLINANKLQFGVTVEIVEYDLFVEDA